MISKVTTIPILISNNPIEILGEGNSIKNIVNYPIESISVSIKDWGIITLDKSGCLKMLKVESTNIQRQKN